MNLLYVVMECAQEDLSQILPQRALTQTEVRDMLAPVLDALGYLHTASFVHGHMKPANIMAVDDQLKISSDGLCRAGRSSASPSKSGAYDAPETSSGVATPAGDVWSLGMTMVESLTQRIPVWERIREEEPSLPDSLPAEFVDLARHCLHRDPIRRWSIADITRWLNPVASAKPQAQPDTPQPASSSRKVAKRSYLLPVAAMALILVAMLAGPKLLTHHMEAQPTPAATPTHSIAEPAPISASAGETKPISSAVAPRPALPKPAQPTKPHATGVVKGSVLEQSLPEISQKARDSIQGKVRVSVRVQVDSTGRVTGAAFDSAGPSKFFADRALQAAPRWKFVPPAADGRNVPSEWVLHFDFSNSGTKVQPTQATP
jgi:TonB family protein